MKTPYLPVGMKFQPASPEGTKQHHATFISKALASSMLAINAKFLNAIDLWCLSYPGNPARHFDKNFISRSSVRCLPFTLLSSLPAGLHMHITSLRISLFLCSRWTFDPWPCWLLCPALYLSSSSLSRSGRSSGRSPAWVWYGCYARYGCVLNCLRCPLAHLFTLP